MVKKFIARLLSRNLLKGLQYDSGLFAASKKGVGTGYDKAWIRDNIYDALGLEAAKDTKGVKRVFHALFDIFLTHEEKIDWAIKQKPDAHFKYIHARYSPHDYSEFHENWGNKQNDAIGLFLFKVGDYYKKEIMVIRNSDDLRILQKLVYYLESVEYWCDEDNGVWEHKEEVHASSVGACVAGLRAVQNMVDVPKELIQKGQTVLNRMLPKESETREVDLALLSLIFPFNTVSVQQRALILKNVEERLVRKNGVIRFFGDDYYANDTGEAEWVMGFAWLAIIYKKIGNKVKYEHYMEKLHNAMTWKGEIPELYYSGSDVFNDNTPLGWAQALYLVAVS